MSIWVSKEPSGLDKLVLAFLHQSTKAKIFKKCKKLKTSIFLIFQQIPLTNVGSTGKGGGGKDLLNLTEILHIVFPYVQ